MNLQLLRRRVEMVDAVCTGLHPSAVISQIYDTNKNDQFITKIAATKEEQIKLMNDGWEYVKNDGNDWYFRKPK